MPSLIFFFFFGVKHILRTLLFRRVPCAVRASLKQKANVQDSRSGQRIFSLFIFSITDGKPLLQRPKQVVGGEQPIKRHKISRELMSMAFRFAGL